MQAQVLGCFLNITRVNVRAGCYVCTSIRNLPEGERSPEKALGSRFWQTSGLCCSHSSWGVCVGGAGACEWGVRGKSVLCVCVSMCLYWSCVVGMVWKVEGDCLEGWMDSVLSSGSLITGSNRPQILLRLKWTKTQANVGTGVEAALRYPVPPTISHIIREVPQVM